ncbi:myelin regulatory factor-like isoform X4 [Stylophora pistillata]|uniref:myelin regulatory factor-like isoform X4 n=1 Tax=Stylophora pistillata TaxID=50429 RepID=UPI000C04BBD9|nr:myelin regulatory factor-like isoform X4 [Stylophora pistillata]
MNGNEDHTEDIRDVFSGYLEELDPDGLLLSNLYECFSSDEKVMADGYMEGTGQLNFGFSADFTANLSLNPGLQCNGILGFPLEGQGTSVGHPIDIPNFGGQHQSKNFPMTPPDSDGPDSPDVNQVLLPNTPGNHHIMLSSISHSGGRQPQQGCPLSSSEELPLQSISVSEPRRKRKRDSESSETLTTNRMSSLRLNSLKSEPDDYCLDGSGSDYLDSPDPFTTTATPELENYQCLKWSPHKTDECCSMFDDSSQMIPPPQFRVDADKGFNYSFVDEAFVCQKKNHLQITAFVNLQSAQTPKYVQGEQKELRRIDKFRLCIYGIKMESKASQIGVEQSQADRSKRHYEPLQFDISPKEQTKITVGRLHFSETTANNMRKKGKPNPDQRYFLLVVAVYAHAKNKEFLVCANVSERIIVRASNPGQFENDMEVVWSRGQTTDSVYRMGRVGINTDRPEEALSVHGNLKVTGRLVHPSDIRVKESIEEVDTREQLRTISRINLYKYRFSREYLEHAGLRASDSEGEDTGVLAQEVKEVLPEAVKESEDVILPDGKMIERFLVVNKERIFMENVGAVKELCKLTDNLEVRIDELETINQKLQRKRCDTVSTFSSLSLSRCSSFRASISSKKPTPERKKRCHHHHYCHYHHHHCACRPHGVVHDEPGWCSPRFMQIVVVSLIFAVVLCVVGITVVVSVGKGSIDKDTRKGSNGKDGVHGVNTNSTESPSLPTKIPPFPNFTSITPSPLENKTVSLTPHFKSSTTHERKRSTEAETSHTLTTHVTSTTPRQTSVSHDRKSPDTSSATTHTPKNVHETSESYSTRRNSPKSRRCCQRRNTDLQERLLRDKQVYFGSPTQPGR